MRSDPSKPVKLGSDGQLRKLHIQRLHLIAAMYASPKSALHGKEAVRKQLLSGVRFWATSDYASENWWWRTIAWPNAWVPPPPATHATSSWIP